MKIFFRKKTTINKIIAFLVIIFYGINIGMGQNNFQINDKESFFQLKEDTIKDEIASFITKSPNCHEIIKSVSLKEISLKRCSDSFAFFEKGNLFASEIIVSIETEEIGQRYKLKELFYIHYKYGFSLPDSVIHDIYVSVPCAEYTSKGKPLSSNYKVYQSGDRKRIYIYMINRESNPNYEVTWVIINDEYYTRVIDVL
ncbi:MAG: hypothetical protein DRI87_05405 [Bacteroidetes bacterium]|jgi:hypothetical protein|nr:MAG: hypothetical protein DRI87_05405 [Bacteroidota bacterium]